MRFVHIGKNWCKKHKLRRNETWQLVITMLSREHRHKTLLHAHSLTSLILQMLFEEGELWEANQEEDDRCRWRKGCQGCSLDPVEVCWLNRSFAQGGVRNFRDDADDRWAGVLDRSKKSHQQYIHYSLTPIPYLYRWHNLKGWTVPLNICYD